MIILNKYTKSLQIVSTIADLQWSTSWVELTQDCQKPSFPSTSYKENQGLTINGIVTMITAPAKNDNTKTYTKQVEYISCYNTGANSLITVQIDDNGTPRILFKITLTTGYTLVYNEDSGWQVLDQNGGITASLTTISVNFVVNEIPSGTINSSNVTFTLAHTPTVNSEMVYYNGQLQRPITDYTISGGTITFVTAPETGSSIYVSYRY